ncbi:uncharacterized protein LOC120327638 [Styela clava]
MINFCYNDDIGFHKVTMTESKQPTPNRLLRPGAIIANPPAPGSPFIPRSQYSLMTPGDKHNPATQSSSATIIQPALISTAVTTRFQVSRQIGSKPQLMVSTGYKPSAGSVAVPRVYSGHASIEKIGTPLNAVSVDTHVKANVKPVPMAKSVPVLLGPGLRQVTKTGTYGDPSQPLNVTRVPVPTNSWVIHQQDLNTPPVSNTSATAAVTVSKTKLIFQNNAVTSTSTTVAMSPHDLSKKHGNLPQTKSTISILPTLPNIPPPEAVHRNALTATPVLSAGNKPIYQVVAPGFQTNIHSQNSAIKKLSVSATIVSQPSASTTTASFPSSTSVHTTGQVTVMTCGPGITYIPAPNPANVSSIPIAKVYPQQQPTSRVALTATSGRLTVPMISSVNTSSSTVSRTTGPAVLQVGSIKPTPTTSTAMTSQSTIVSTIPVAANNKSVALCWPTTLNYAAQQTISSAGSTAASRPSITITSTSNPHQVATAIRVQHGSSVLTTHLQGSGGAAPSLLQVTDTANRSNTSHNQVNPPSGGGPSTPTMSPKPAILRRQRPDSSNVLKKLSFTSASNFPNQRRDFHTLPNDRRSAPYHINRQKLTNNAGEMKDVPIIVPTAGNQNEKGETKPVLPNQVYGNKIIPSNGITPLKVNSIKTHSSQFSNNPAKEGANQSFSIHPLNIDLQVKMEPPGHSAFHTTSQQQQHTPVKSESNSASQKLHFQNQSMHTYAAESPQISSNVPHRIVTQASGQHIKTNTIFTKPALYPGQPRSKAAQVIKSTPSVVASSTGTAPQPYLPTGPVNHNVNSFIHQRMRPDSNHPGERISAFDHVKKEHQSITEHPKTSVDNIITQLQNHTPPNHLISAISPAKLWTNMNNVDQLTGLSPRKRPRKQTHIVSEDPPEVVMEDEESTDDADECEDEPMADITSAHDVSTTPSVKLPGHKPSALLHRQTKTEVQASKKVIKEESHNKSSSYVKTEASKSPTLSESKPLSEYTDRNGVRYVASRKRPSVAILNKAKPHTRPISNHYLHYSDVRVKEKKTTVSDLGSDKKRLKGFKIARFAFQLDDMVGCEKDVYEKMQAVYNGLVEYKSSLVTDATFENNLASPSPGTPTSLSNSFRKATSTRSSRSGSISGTTENRPVNSPSTPLDRRSNKVKDEISNIEELAQANLQRCRVVSDQISEAKTMLLKCIDHRQLVSDILQSPTNQKTQSHTPNSPQSMKRMPKKKNNS